MSRLVRVRYLPTLVAFTLLAFAARAADRITLKDGIVLEGRIVYDTPGNLVILQGTKEREVRADEATEVRSVERSLKLVLTRWEQAPAANAAAQLELAKVARAFELEGEAQVFALSALLADPGLDAAHEFLGHEKKSGVWHVREGKRLFPFHEIDRVHADWKDAHRLSTLHFELRSNMPLAKTLAAALELELVYRTFYDRFRSELSLRDVVSPMAAQIHADRLSYPGGPNRPGFFDPQLNTFFQDASLGYDPRTTSHEVTHQLLHNTTARTKAALGSIPAWIDEGLADTIGMSRSGEPGHARYDPALRAKFYFQIHASAKKPYDLSRVLALATMDFITSSHVDLAYAQSYTLVQYCLNGKDKQYRAGFFEYLRRCYAGKSSMTEFKDALAIKEAPFEAEWHAYAKSGP